MPLEVRLSTSKAMRYASQRLHFASNFTTDVCAIEIALNVSIEVYGAAVQQLSRRLTHHMFYIAERLELFETKLIKEGVVENAYWRWEQRANVIWRDVSDNCEITKTFGLDRDLSELEARPAQSPLPSLSRHVERAELRKITKRLAFTHKSAAMQRLKKIRDQFDQLISFVREEAFSLEAPTTPSNQASLPNSSNNRDGFEGMCSNGPQSSNGVVVEASARGAARNFLEQTDHTAPVGSFELMDGSQHWIKNAGDVMHDQQLNHIMMSAQMDPQCTHTSTSWVFPGECPAGTPISDATGNLYLVEDFLPAIMDHSHDLPLVDLNEKTWCSARDPPLQDPPQDRSEQIETGPKPDWVSEHPLHEDSADGNEYWHGAWLHTV